MNVFVLAPQENWICDRIAEEWRQNNLEVNCNSPEEADVLWLLAGWCWNHIKPEVLSSKRTIVTVHHVVPEKFTEEKLKEFMYRDKFVDAYHTPNKNTALFIRQLTKKPIFIVPYWYDENKWKPLNPDKSRDKLGIPKNKFVIGSFQRDSEGETGLPKLEKGPDILCETIQILHESLDEDIHVLLGGWRRSYVEKELKERKIPYTLNELADLETLARMYAACDLYIVSSRFEGGPQALLEASAMKVPIISRDVGMATSILSPYSIIDMPKQICLPTSDSIEFNFNSVKRYEINAHKKNYLDMFERVLK
jgi:glycosyltransferase involved in cell wall biosynthesis